MPLSDDTRHVASSPQRLGQGLAPRIENQTGIPRQDTRTRSAKCVLPHHQCVAGGGARRGRCVRVEESDPFPRQPVEVRRVQRRRSIAGEIPESSIIQQDQDDVWWLLPAPLVHPVGQRISRHPYRENRCQNHAEDNSAAESVVLMPSSALHPLSPPQASRRCRLPSTETGTALDHARCYWIIRFWIGVKVYLLSRGWQEFRRSLPILFSLPLPIELRPIPY